MNRNNVGMIWENMAIIMKKLPAPGILMICGDNNKENIITLGWLQFGVIWNEPVVSILVRPSRYSYELLNKNSEFTLNIMPDIFNEEIKYCGAKSGRYVDKFSETKLKKNLTTDFSVSTLKEAEITLECKILHKNSILPDNLSDLIHAKYYSDGDYHEMFTAGIHRFKLNMSSD